MSQPGTPVPARPTRGQICGAGVLVTFVAAIIAVAFRGSWGALRDAALATHFDRDAADLYPFAVDGLLIIAIVAAVMLRNDRVARWYCLGIIAGYTVASWAINFMHGLGMFGVDPATGSRPVPPWPVVMLIASLVIASIFLASHLLVYVWRHLFPTGRDTSTVRHTICAGPSGALTLRRPLPRRDLELAAPAGTRVHLPDVLSGAHSPIVYLIRNGGRVKIGTSGNLRRRISQLCLRAEDVVLVLHGDGEYETELHERFADLRVGDTEWFKLSGELTEFVAAGGDPDDAPYEDAEIADDGSEEDAEADEETATPRRQAERRSGGRTRKKVVRHSLDRWADLTESIWRQESDRLGRQPTGEEFAAAIRKARRGPVSVTTAKKIRAEILRRAELATGAATLAATETAAPPEHRPAEPARYTPNGRAEARTGT